MARPQYSLLQLVLLVGAAGMALGLARVLVLFGPWAFEIGVAPLILLIALVAAIFNRGIIRAYLIGFQVWGWLGFVVSFSLYVMLMLRKIHQWLEQAMIDDNAIISHLLFIAVVPLPTIVAAHLGGLFSRWHWRVHSSGGKTQT